MDDLDPESAHPRQFAAAVRARPQMWFGSTDASGLHELVCEVMAHLVDLAVTRKVTRIDVTIEGPRFTVSDDGPGMPTLPVDGLPLMTAVFVRPGLSATYDGHGLHSQLSARSQLPAVNAACDEISILTYRPDGVYEQRFSGGEAVSALGWRGRTAEEGDAVGTRMVLEPSPEVFGEARIDVDALRGTLGVVRAFLPHLSIVIDGEPLPDLEPQDLVGGGHALMGQAREGHDMVEVTLVESGPRRHRHRAFLNFRELTGDPEMVEHCVAEALESAYGADVPPGVSVVVNALFALPEFTGPDMRVCASPRLKDLVVSAVNAAIRSGAA